jgi:SAM-dependent methyltransferase
VLTVRYDRLGLQPGDRVLDLGCGFGRHGFEAGRRGGHVVAVDYAHAELVSVTGTFGAMESAGELTATAYPGGVRADATRLPFSDASFDRVIASEVFEHIVDDASAFAELARVLRPGGVLAVTVPAEGPEKLCWRLSDDYHAPAVPGGHVRIYSRIELDARLRAAGLRPEGAHRAHALHSPYWWLRCAVGPARDDHPAVAAYRKFLEWDIVSAPAATRVADRLLNPLLGKSLVVYARKPA